MYGIGVIPENTEVFCCGLKSSKTLYGFIRVGISLWIGVFGNTPDTFNRRILRYQTLYHIHVRSFSGHGYRNHLNPEMLGNRKMSVITGCRAKERNPIQLTPWSASHYTMGHGAGDGIIHNIQAGVTTYNYVLRLHSHDFSHELSGLRNTL